MSKIKQLDAHTTNMIAAGEVVERPMGVVKELVENAIDAGSTRITVSIEEGGMKKVTITDNGCGMDATDAEMCFQRHATSKIHSENDLWSIHTLGFRGEALPSIAAVSRVTIVTSDGNDSTRIEVAYGKKESASPYPCNQGTEISVEGLFYHTPARLKHMRSASYESSLIQDVVQKFALSHPEISFRLVNDGRDAFRTSGQGDLLEVMFAVFGRGTVENAIEVSFEDFDYSVKGYIVKPSITRASRNLMHIFLNGRMVKTYRLFKAIQDGYAGLISEGRYPVCVLNIEMDPHLLDVNVHPSKWEVRISKEIQLEVLLKDGVRKALNNEEVIEEVKAEPVTYYQPISFDTEDLERTEKPSVSLKSETKTLSVTAKEETSMVFPSFDAEAIRKEAEEDAKFLQSLQETLEEKKEKREREEDVPVFPSMTVIGQFRKRYILCECERGLAVIDAHEARRKIFYEKAEEKITSNVTMEDLLVPVTLHVTDDLYHRCEEINEVTKTVFITFEPFGEGTFLVRTLPSWLKNINIEQFLQDILDSFHEETTEDIMKNMKKKVAMAASRNVSAKKETLNREDMEAVLEDLEKCRNPFTAISGKPIVVVMDEKQFLKGFGL